MSLGLERAGFDVCWQVEIDEFCNDIRPVHFPRALQYLDVRMATDLPHVDLIAGGFPCQDISCAGKGAGLDGQRSGLWREFVHIVRQLGPRWVLAENVPALRTRGADRVLDDLEQAGYTCWPLVVGARHVGAPHKRDRVWVVAHGHGHGREAERGGRLQHGERSASGHDADGRDGTRLEHVARSGLEGGRYRFPARPGQPQHSWESPRTTEPWVGRGTDGVPSVLDRAIWKHRLKALGNAVVPQVVEAIGRSILAVEATL